MPLATDSAAELKKILGDDATATFESDPKFIDADPTGTASSDNVEVQRDADDTEDSEEELEDAEDDDELDEDDDDLEDDDDDDVDMGDEDEEEEEDDADDVGVTA